MRKRPGVPVETLLPRRSFLQSVGGAGGALLLAAEKAPAGDTASLFRPEYERRFEEVLIVYDQVALPYYLSEVLQILACLPPHRRLYVLVSEKRKEKAQKDLKGLQLKPHFIVCKHTDLWGDWGRDIFFPGWRKGHTVLFVPYTKNARSRGQLTRAYEVLRVLEDERHRVVLVPLVFEGGNMAYDRVGGKRTLFVGTSVLVESGLLYRRYFGRSLEAKSCLEILKRFFSVDMVVPLGRFQGGKPLRQASFLFHIDLACAIVAEGVVAVERFEVPSQRKELREEIAAELAFQATQKVNSGSPAPLRDRIEEETARQYHKLQEAHRELGAIRGIFRSLGYRIVDLPTDWRRVRRTQSYANVLVGADRVVMPVFPRPGSGRTRTRSYLGRRIVEILVQPKPSDYALVGWNLKNYRIYRSLFGDVRVVRDSFYLAGGNVHCVIGSLG